MVSRKVTWLLLLLIFFSSTVESQSIVARLDLGKREPTPDYYVYSHSDRGLVTLGQMVKATSRKVGLRKYDRNFDLEWKTEVFEQDGYKNLDFLAVIGQNILVFVSEFFPKEKIIKTYYYSYDLSGRMLIDKGLLSIFPNQKEQKVELQYVLSPNKQRLLAFKNLRNDKETERLMYYLFDEAGELVQNGEFTINYPDNRFSVRTLRVSNQGNIFILGEFSPPGNARRDAVEYIIYRYDRFEEQGKEIPIDPGNRVLSEVAFRIDPYENIYVAGFYSNRGSDQLAGTVLGRYSREGELEMYNINEFDPQFMANYLTANQIRKGKELRNFNLDPENGLVLRSDGGVLLLIEKMYVTYNSYRDMFGYWVDEAEYHFEDVILTSVAPDGQIEWHSIINKQQVSLSAAQLSYFNAIGGGYNYVFYEYRPRGKNTNIYFNRVGIDGQTSPAVGLLKDFRNDDVFYPRYCEQISNNEAILVYFKNRGKVFSLIKLNLAS